MIYLQIYVRVGAYNHTEQFSMRKSRHHRHEQASSEVILPSFQWQDRLLKGPWDQDTFPKPCPITLVKHTHTYFSVHLFCGCPSSIVKTSNLSHVPPLSWSLSPIFPLPMNLRKKSPFIVVVVSQ